MKEAEKYAYQFAVSEAEIRKREKAVAQLKKNRSAAAYVNQKFPSR